MSGRCIVKRDGADVKIGIIYIPEKHRTIPTTGTILAVGDIGPTDEGRLDYSDLVGKRVAWGRYSGVPLHFKGGHQYDVLTYEEILAVITDHDIEMDIESLASLTRDE
jgi:co-chaperonin GroES (HSP10)